MKRKLCLKGRKQTLTEATRQGQRSLRCWCHSCSHKGSASKQSSQSMACRCICKLQAASMIVPSNWDAKMHQTRDRSHHAVGSTAIERGNALPPVRKCILSICVPQNAGQYSRQHPYAHQTEPHLRSTTSATLLNPACTSIHGNSHGCTLLKRSLYYQFSYLNVLVQEAAPVKL